MSRDSDTATSDAAIVAARELFLRDDNYYGCAEATLVAVQQRYGFDDAISVPARHDAFIESGVWRETCMRQTELSVARFWRLA
ncbi:MAG: hypothetical protein ACC658_02140 [Acidimicrobiia bacterium]